MMAKRKKIRVLLLDGHTVQAYSTLRALHQVGIYTTVFCEKRISYGYACRFSNCRIKCPSIKNESDIFFKFLKNFLSKAPHDILIPLYDESADFVNANREEIEALEIKVALAQKESYSLVRDKATLMEFCKANEIPHPETIRLTANNLEYAAKKIGFPSLIKPVMSSGANGIVYLQSLSDLKKNYAEIKKRHGNSLLQTFIKHPGYYYNAMLFRDRDNVYSKTVTIKINRYFPTKGGTSSFAESIVNKEIDRISQTVLNRLNWIGFADFDFIIDINTNIPKLIEINPRIPACIHASLVSGINFPQIIVYNALGEKMPEQFFMANKQIRYMALDILWFFFNKNRLKVKPGWFNFFSKNLHYQDGSWDDPLTMIAGFLMGIRKYMNASIRHSKFRNT